MITKKYQIKNSEDRKEYNKYYREYQQTHKKYCQICNCHCYYGNGWKYHQISKKHLAKLN